MKKHLSITATMLLSLIILTSCSSLAKKQQANASLKATAMKAQDAFFKDYDAEAVKKYFNEDYIQHNPNVPTGLEPVLGFLPLLKKQGVTSTTHRILADGNFIAMHNTYNNAGAFGFGHDIVTFDVWRIENGKVAEHWDAIEPIAPKNRSGRTQVDGPTEITDLDKTEANKKLVVNFIEDVFMSNNIEKAAEHISAEQYDQHHFRGKDGLDSFTKSMNYLISQNNMFKFKKIHRVIGEGNFILTQSEGEWGDKDYAFYDLFRVEDRKIVEHWDVVQEIPEKMAHNNGMF